MPHHKGHYRKGPPLYVEMEEALAESLKLQSHYAKLLNMYDGGQRIGFDSIEKWLEELKKGRNNE